jgi:hypothetical protein
MLSVALENQLEKFYFQTQLFCLQHNGLLFETRRYIGNQGFIFIESIAIARLFQLNLFSVGIVRLSIGGCTSQWRH